MKRLLIATIIAILPTITHSAEHANAKPIRSFSITIKSSDNARSKAILQKVHTHFTTSSEYSPPAQLDSDCTRVISVYREIGKNFSETIYIGYKNFWLYVNNDTVHACWYTCPEFPSNDDSIFFQAGSEDVAWKCDFSKIEDSCRKLPFDGTITGVE